MLAFITSMSLLMKRPRAHKDLLLAVLLICLTVQLLQAFLSIKGYYFQYPELMHLGSWTLFINGPALYFYARSQLNLGINKHKHHKQWLSLLHLIPALLALIWLIPFFLLEPSVKYQTYYQVTDKKIAFWSLFLIHLATYWILSARLTWSHLKSSPTKTHQQLYWLTLPLLAAFACYLVTGGYTLLSLLLTDNYPTSSDFLSLCLLSGIVLYIIVLNTAKPSLFINPKTQPYQTKPTQDEKLLKQIEHLMNEQKVFLKEDYQLKDLALALELKPQQVSSFLNHKLQQNFNQLINSYRIQEAQKLIKLHSQRSLVTIGLDVGFNSNATFYRVFKDIVGLSPGEYRKSLKTEK